MGWGWVFGDLDGDGIFDSGHELSRTYDDGSTDKESGAVSGRTTEKLWSGPLGQSMEGSLDGVGEDLLEVDFSGEQILLTARDGRDGQELWVRAIPFFVTYQLDAWVIEVDGDPSGELLLTGPFAHHPGYLLSGEDGQVMWPAAAAPWSQTKPYIAAGSEFIILGPLTTDLANPCAHDDIGQGGTCFLLLGGEQNVTITINDQTGQSVAALVSFFTNVYAYESNVCGNGTLDVPVGTNRMWVRPVADEGFFCVSPAIPTAGTITATFS